MIISIVYIAFFPVINFKKITKLLTFFSSRTSVAKPERQQIEFKAFLTSKQKLEKMLTIMGLPQTLIEKIDFRRLKSPFKEIKTTRLKNLFEWSFS